MTEKFEKYLNENRNYVSDEDLDRIYDVLLELAGGYTYKDAFEAFEQILDIINK